MIEIKGLQALTDAINRVMQVVDALPEMGETVRGEALGHAIIGANRNVYETTPGNYRRTMDYLRGFHASKKATRNTVTVTVWNNVGYAEAVEQGSSPHLMQPAQIVAQAMSKPYEPLYFGRSGQKYILPGPAVYPASVFALHRVRELFIKRVYAALKP